MTDRERVLAALLIPRAAFHGTGIALPWGVDNRPDGGVVQDTTGILRLGGSPSWVVHPSFTADKEGGQLDGVTGDDWPASFLSLRKVVENYNGTGQNIAYVGREVVTTNPGAAKLILPGDVAYDNFVAIQGNSLWARPNGWGKRGLAAASVLGKTYQIFNDSFDGATAAGLAPRYFSVVLPARQAFTGTGKTVHYFGDGTNQLLTDTKENTYTQIEDYPKTAAQSFDWAGAGTISPRVQEGLRAGFDADRLFINAALRADYTVAIPGTYGFLSNIPALARTFLFDVDAIPGHATTDGIHDTEERYNQVGVEFGKVLAAL